MERLPISGLTIHPQCELIPRMRPDEWSQFAADVEQHGVLEPIVVQKGGVVLDGRHRLEAARLRGDETIPARIVDLSEKEQITFVVTVAILRRHLSDDQRSVLAARFHEPLSKAARVDRARKAGESGGIGRPKSNSLSDTSADKLLPKVDTRRDVADQFHVSERRLRSAAEVERSRPDLANRVLAGDLTLPQAKQELRREQKLAEMQQKAAAVASEAGDQPAWEIRHGDCLVELESILDPVRLIFADPPYNIGIDYGTGPTADSLPADEYLAWCRVWIDRCADCLTPDGSLWILINDEWADHFGVMLREARLHRRAWIKWYESFGTNCSGNFNRCSRHLFYCVRHPKRFVFDESAVTRPSDRQTKYGDKRADPGGKLWDNVWGINPPIPRLTGTCQERIPEFPTQLPLALVEPIVLCASEPGDLVVDPFNGSGTTGVAALRHGRRYIGIEQSDRFAELARLRLKGLAHA